MDQKIIYEVYGIKKDGKTNKIKSGFGTREAAQAYIDEEAPKYFSEQYISYKIDTVKPWQRTA